MSLPQPVTVNPDRTRLKAKVKNIRKNLIFLIAVVIILTNFGCNNRKELIQALQSKDTASREEAAKALFDLKDPKTVEPLIAVLGDESLTVREYAKGTLQSIGEPAVLPLIAALNNESWPIRRIAENTLWKIDPLWIRREEAVQAAPYFIQNFKDENEYVRERAMQSLQNIGDPAKDYLISALKDENEKISYFAGRTLVEIDLFWTRSEAAQKAIPELVAALRDTNPKIRVNAKNTLVRIGRITIKHVLVALRDKEWKVQKRAEVVLDIIDPNWPAGDEARKAIPDFIAALKSEDEAIRLGAVIALGRIQDNRVIEPLIDSLDDKFLYARVNATRALEEITGKEFGKDLGKWQNWWMENKEADFFKIEE
jgi:HEAT repeat protein